MKTTNMTDKKWPTEIQRFQHSDIMVCNIYVQKKKAVAILVKIQQDILFHLKDFYNQV